METEQQDAARDSDMERRREVVEHEGRVAEGERAAAGHEREVSEDDRLEQEEDSEISEELRQGAEELRAAAEVARQVHATAKADLAALREERALEPEVARKLLEELSAAVADADARAQILAELLSTREQLRERQRGSAT
jgi:hypothetical protein